MRFLVFLLIIISFITNSYAKENSIYNIADGIAQMCAASIYNYDLDTVKDIINENIKTHNQIIAIKIVDITTKDVLYQAFEKEGKIFENKNIYEGRKDINVIKRQIRYNLTPIAILFVYYKKNKIFDIADGIAQMCATSIFNYDFNTVKNIINESIKTNRQIVAIKIIDIAINDVLYQASEKDDKIVENKNIYEGRKDINVVKRQITYNSTPIALLFVYYTNVKETRDLKKINLTKNEKEYIKKHGIFRFSAFSNWPPFNFTDKNGNYIGMITNYMKIISERTGLKFKQINVESCNEAVTKLERKKLDMIVCSFKTEELNKLLYFSKPYMSYPIVMVTTLDKPFLQDMDFLENKAVGVIKNYPTAKFLQYKHVNLKLIYFENILQALQAVSDKKVYAFLSALPVAAYNINKYGFVNLKIAGRTKYNLSASIGIRKDLGKTGIDIINKAIKSIPKHEKIAIYNQWVNIKFEKGIDYSLLWKIIFVALIIFCVFLYWNRKLQTEIEERKKIEKKLEEAKSKAEIATKYKSIFLANMSHEIRTPMNAIIGFASLLNKLITNPVQRDYINSIKTAGKELLSLINDILDLSKIEAGRLEIKQEPTNIFKLFEDIKNIFNFKIKQKNLTFITDIDKSLPETVFIDSSRLKQILINLIENAIKFTDRGSITLKAEVISKDFKKNRINLKIAVIDTGCGIAKEHQTIIFKSFKQINEEDKTESKGTGLGLAISSKLAKLMNGEILVESEVGKGSKFHLILYNLEAAASIVDSKSLTVNYSNIKFKKAKILIVDDIDTNRKVVTLLLQNTGLETIEAVNGEHALEILEKVPDIALILMDLRMPVMGGYEATEKIRENEKLKNIPVIAFTAFVLDEKFKKVGETPFDGYLLKPVVYNNLIKVLMKHLEYYECKVDDEISEHEKLDEEIIEQLPEIVKKLQGEFKEKLFNVKDSGDFSLIKDVAEKIKVFGVEKSLTIIVNYVNSVLDAIDTYDVKKVNLLINHYDSICDELKIIYQKNKNIQIENKIIQN